MGRTEIYACGDNVSRQSFSESVVLLSLKQEAPTSIGGNTFTLFISMLLIGLWHGAGWTFVAWGALHGAFLLINHQWRRLGITLPKVLAWLITFFVVDEMMKNIDSVK